MTSAEGAGPDLRHVVIDLEARLAEAGLPIGVEARDERLMLVGAVGSEEGRQAALDIALALADGVGVEVDDNLEVTEFSPESTFADDDQATGTDEVLATDLVDFETESAGRDQISGGLEMAGDFAADPGTTNTIRASGDADVMVEPGEDEPYFPPTDPVVGTTDTTEGLEVIGGYGATSMGENDLEASGQTDDALAEIVLRELREDAYTTDFKITVSARGRTVFLRGEVATIEDAEYAESVANRLEGVDDVREELTIPGLQRDR